VIHGAGFSLARLAIVHAERSMDTLGESTPSCGGATSGVTTPKVIRDHLRLWTRSSNGVSNRSRRASILRSRTVIRSGRRPPVSIEETNEAMH
jgi:hypothetical protein